MTGFGLGYAPVASGTFGSAGALVIALAIWAVGGYAGISTITLSLIWAGLALTATLACGAWGEWAIKHFAGRARKPGDPGQVVLDEWAGQWIALVGFAMPTLGRAAAVMAVQFFLFRLFDVIKPPPGRRLEKLPAGWGIALDDVAAGVYANLVGQVLFIFLLP
jgi:phosphatidylglycerophosphatase A